MTGRAYQFSPTAKKDLQKIIDYTIDNFGIKHAKKYVRSLEKCADNLAQGNLSRSIPDISPITTFIKCKHHYIFGFSQKEEPFYVVAIFHEKMDLIQRLKKRLS